MEKQITNRQQQAIETKRNLMDCACRLFQERDYTQVTIAEIAEKAGVSVGNFYNYYDSKEDIIMQKHIEFNEQVEQKFSRQKFNNNLDALRSLIRLQILSAHNAGSKIMAQSIRIQLLTQGKHVLEDDRYFNRHVKRLVEQAIENEELTKSCDAEELTQILLRQSRGLILDWAMRDGFYSILDIAMRELDLVLCCFIPKKIETSS